MSESDSGVKAVWTDFGGVLTPPAIDSLRSFSELVGVAPEQLGTAMFAVAQSYGTDDPMEPLDTPLVDEAEWSRQVERELSARFGVEADLSGFSEKWFRDRPPNTAWLEHLRTLRERGLFVGMLSNMVPGFDPYWRRMAPPEGLFDDLVLSYQVGTRKPRREIFELAAERAGTAPGQCVLVDDLPPHCEGARAAGWQAVHFTSAEDAIPQLEALLA